MKRHGNAGTAQAIGARNIVDSQGETRRRKQREVQALIDEKIAEHDRCVPLPPPPPWCIALSLAAAPRARLSAEYDSLVRVEREQQEMLDRMMSSTGV